MDNGVLSQGKYLRFHVMCKDAAVAALISEMGLRNSTECLGAFHA